MTTFTTKQPLHFIPWFWTLASLGVAVVGTPNLAQAAVSYRDVVIERVVDGDTVHVRDLKNRRIKVRMQGMDTPETHLVTGNGVVGQMPWGDDATRELERLLPVGRRAELEDFGTDKYGRTLGHVVLNGRNANIEQVRRGQAVSYIICGPGNCNEDFLEEIHAEEIVEACHQAKKAGLGIFNPSNPLKELPFEFRLRHQKRKADKYVGNIATREYVTPSRYESIPVCDRIFFLSEQDAKDLGFRRR